MSDYERYGDYNDDPDEERGPARSRPWVFLLRILRIAVLCILFGVCGVLAFRMITSGYYPNEIERIYYTEKLASYAQEHTLYTETQSIRVPFGDTLIVVGDDGRLVQSESRYGYYYADNLILERTAGSLQVSIRINKNDMEKIAAHYSLTDFAFSDDAFSFELYNNECISEDKTLTGEDKSYKLDKTAGDVYYPTYITTDSALMYHYIKICFDDIDFENVKWLRLEITPKGVDKEFDSLGICVYENNDSESQFKEYKLKKPERLS